MTSQAIIAREVPAALASSDSVKYLRHPMETRMQIDIASTESGKPEKAKALRVMDPPLMHISSRQVTTTPYTQMISTDFQIHAGQLLI
jgi:hypothetical protein